MRYLPEFENRELTTRELRYLQNCKQASAKCGFDHDFDAKTGKIMYLGADMDSSTVKIHYLAFDKFGCCIGDERLTVDMFMADKVFYA